MQALASRQRFVQTLALLLLAVCACSPADETPTEATPVPDTGSAAGNAAPSVEALTNPSGEALPEQLGGTWWCFIPERPQRGFRATLVPAEQALHWGGSWVSFDWRGTASVESLHRVTKPVEIQAEYSDKQLILRGPAPQIDAATGQPTGATGQWEMRLRLASLPGESLRFAGRLLSDDDAPDAEGLAVDATPSFKSWGS